MSELTLEDKHFFDTSKLFAHLRGGECRKTQDGCIEGWKVICTDKENFKKSSGSSIRAIGSNKDASYDSLAELANQERLDYGLNGSDGNIFP